MLLLAGRSTPFRRMTVRKIPALLGIVVAVGVAYALYQTYLGRSGTMQAPPQQRSTWSASDHVARDGAGRAPVSRRALTYGTLEQLQQDGLRPAARSSGATRSAWLQTGARLRSPPHLPTPTNRLAHPDDRRDDAGHAAVGRALDRAADLPMMTERIDEAPDAPAMLLTDRKDGRRPRRQRSCEQRPIRDREDHPNWPAVCRCRPASAASGDRSASQNSAPSIDKGQ